MLPPALGYDSARQNSRGEFIHIVACCGVLPPDDVRKGECSNSGRPAVGGTLFLLPSNFGP